MQKEQVLLREFYGLCEGGVCQDLLTEQEKIDVSSGAIILSGIMQRADERNANGRVYSKKILEREVSNYQRIIQAKRSTGELDHPESNIISLKEASHLVTSIWWNGNDVMGKIKILSHTPNGNILAGLIKDGVNVGISSRGLGTLSEDHAGNLLVEDDFMLICFDIVQEPSTNQAFMKPVFVNESYARNTMSNIDIMHHKLNLILEL